MSLAFSFTDAEQKIEEIDVNKYVRYTIADLKQNMQKLSLLIGKEEGFIRRPIQRKQLSCRCCTPLPFT